MFVFILFAINDINAQVIVIFVRTIKVLCLFAILPKNFKIIKFEGKKDLEVYFYLKGTKFANFT